MAKFTPSIVELPAGSDINASSDRRAMGLPDHYVEARFEDASGVFQGLAKFGPEELACRVEDPRIPLNERLAAGKLLGLIGDPRIDPFDPTMIAIPGGQAVLGLESEKVDAVAASLGGIGVLTEWILKECPKYTIALAPFRIGKYQVTNYEYRQFLADTRYAELPTSWEFGRFPEERANHPVYTVSERAADEYALWLAVCTGRKLRLPSEAEWEYAAAGPDRREFPWGNDFNSECANTRECGLLTTTPIGAFPQGNSPFGVSDMAGNVEEYVADHFRPYPGSTVAVEDDLQRSRGHYRVARGGSFTRFRDLARCKRRHGRYPKPIYVMGIRLAEDL